jgi:hypothetical protein
MRRMWVIAQAIDDPDLDTFKRREGSIVQQGHVGRISEISKPEPNAVTDTMVLTKRHHIHALGLKRLAIDERTPLGGRFVEIGVVPTRLP